MSHTLKINGMLVTSEEADGDGRLERRTIQATFFVPLDGRVTGWHFDTNGGARSIDITHFEFEGPNVGALVSETSSKARKELLNELRAMNLDQITEYLNESIEDDDA